MDEKKVGKKNEGEVFGRISTDGHLLPDISRTTIARYFQGFNYPGYGDYYYAREEKIDWKRPGGENGSATLFINSRTFAWCAVENTYSSRLLRRGYIRNGDERDKRDLRAFRRTSAWMACDIDQSREAKMLPERGRSCFQKTSIQFLLPTRCVLYLQIDRHRWSLCI